MIEWWGPILVEYYAGTEGNGATFIASEDWLHASGLGRPRRASASCTSSTRTATTSRPTTEGTIYFASGRAVRVPQRPGEDREARDSRAAALDARRRRLRRRRRLPVPDRSQGVHDHLGRREHLSAGDRGRARHPPEGRRRRRVRHPRRGLRRAGEGGRAADRRRRADPTTRRASSSRYAASALAGFKVPRSIDFEAELPRLPTGKLYKRMLRDRYMGKTTTIV